MPRRRQFYEPIIESPTRAVAPEGWPFHQREAGEEAAVTTEPTETPVPENTLDGHTLDGQPVINAFHLSEGVYAKVDEIAEAMRSYADEWDHRGNPSAALALREFADSLVTPGGPA